MNLVLLGPPGAGKGTLANLLKEQYKVCHISTGDILREEMKNNTPLGLEAKQFIDNGKLVPDEVVIRLIEQKLVGDVEARKNGYLLDGFPRTKAQAQDLDKILKKVNSPIDFVLYLEATLPIIIHRLTGRRVCKKCGAVFHATNRPPRKPGICDQCGSELYQRADDKEETIKTRMDVYLNSTQPIVDYYAQQGFLKKLNADQESEELQAILTKDLNEERKQHWH
jgi:adenylate kinase